jgi:uncharacterized protein (TIGR03067 family)
VAYRTARRAKAVASRRRVRERQMRTMPEISAEPTRPAPEWETILDEELSRLPDKYRLPLVLCDLEGRPGKQVALHLKLPAGTLFSQLSRARRMLAQRLRRRGIVLSSGALATMFSGKTVLASVPFPLLSSTIKAATKVTAEGAATVAVSAKVAALTQGVLKAMFLTRLKTVSAPLLLVLCLGGGGSAVLSHAFQTDASGAQPTAGEGNARRPETDEQQRQKRDSEAVKEADKTRKRKGDEQKRRDHDAEGEKKANGTRNPKDDEEQLRGMWKLIEAAENGKKGKIEDADEDAVLTFRGETLHFKMTRRKDATTTEDRFFVFKLYTTTTPKLIDLADWKKGFDDNNDIIEGIYALDGNTLTICFAFGSFGENQAKKNRPTTLISKEGQNTSIWTLTKEKAGK